MGDHIVLGNSFPTPNPNWLDTKDTIDGPLSVDEINHWVDKGQGHVAEKLCELFGSEVPILHGEVIVIID